LVINQQSGGHGVSPLDLSTKPGEAQAHPGYSAAEVQRQTHRGDLCHGQAEGKALGEPTVILRLLSRRCGPLDAATAPTARRRRREPELQGC
jgi:hypothetical protein